MPLPRLFFIAVLLCQMTGGVVHAAKHQTSAGPVEVVQVVSGLNRPWSFGFLPDGGILITERDVGKI